MRADKPASCSCLERVRLKSPKFQAVAIVTLIYAAWEIAAGTGKEDKEEAKVDIIAVHGLNPWGNPDHAFDTWRKPKGLNGNLWLRDDLPKAIPNARIFLYQYDSNPAFGNSKERFVHQANDLLERIHIKRTECSSRPILLLGHSLGGILIKQALVNAHSNARYRPIKEATTGLVFFGTPHAGGKDALVSIGKISAKVATSILRNPSKDVMEALTKGSLFSEVLQESWRHQLNLYKVVSFYEGIGDIVPRDSAVLGLSGDVENQVRLEADHSNVCCFDLSIEDDVDNYEVVAANIKELYKACLKRSVKADGEADNSGVVKANGGGVSISLVAGCFSPNPKDYESDNMDYATALHNDIKRTTLHILVMQDQKVALQSSRYKNPGAPVNDLNSNNDYPFHTAATFGRGHVWASFFLRNSVQINAKNNQGNTVLHLYMIADMDEEERAAVVFLILRDRPDTDVNIKNRDAYTPLGLAVWLSRYRVIGFLIKAGANLTDPAFVAGNTILHYAVFLKRIACTQLLVAAGAPVNSTNHDGNTPLIMAAKSGSEPILTALLEGGADMEKRNAEGLGPVEMAVKERNFGCLKILAEKGARLTPPAGSNGPVALQIAREQEDQQIVEFLLSKGG